MFRFIHAADIHLDSPLLNLQRYENAPFDRFRSATRRAFDNLIELAIQQQVAFLLIAGDLFDGDCSDLNTPIYIRRGLEQLAQNDIRVFLIQGNHDAAANVSKAYRLEFPKNVHRFSTSKPETICLEDQNVAIHGQGFSEREVLDDLSADYPRPIPGMFNLGLLHTNCGGRAGHDPYAPSHPQELTDKRYDYWALGHIHKRQSLTIDEACPIWYSGNLQGRQIRETGAKGCQIVTVERGRVSNIEFAAVDVLRWAICDVDTSQCVDSDEVLTATCQNLTAALGGSEGRPIAARVRFVGNTAAHHDLHRHRARWIHELRVETLSQFGDSVWVEKVLLECLPRVAESANPSERRMDLEIAQGLADPSLVAAALGDVRAEIEKARLLIPTDDRVPDQAFDVNNAADAQRLGDDAQDLLRSRLKQEEI